MKEKQDAPVRFVVDVDEFVILEGLVTSIADEALLMPCGPKSFNCSSYDHISDISKRSER